MKYFLHYPVLIFCFLSSIAKAENPVVSAGCIVIPLSEITQLAHQSILERSPLYLGQEPARGASNTVALILSGLAQTCAQVSQALPENPLQQVVFGTVATSLATAAAVIIDRKQQREQKKTSRAQLAKALTDLVLQLEQTDLQTKNLMPSSALFSSLRAIKSPENKQVFINLILDEHALADDFLYEFIEVAENYFADHQEALTEAVKVGVSIVFVDWLCQQKCTQESSVIDLNAHQNSGVIIYTPSETGHELPALINQVATEVTTRLLVAYAAAASSIS